MKIELITKQEYDRLILLKSQFPALSLQNVGYEEIDFNALTDAEKDAHLEVSEILMKSISGFQRFQNFRVNKKGESCVRFQYNYDWRSDKYGFIGVGYILLSELLNGFN